MKNVQDAYSENYKTLPTEILRLKWMEVYAISRLQNSILLRQPFPSN